MRKLKNPRDVANVFATGHDFPRMFAGWFMPETSDFVPANWAWLGWAGDDVIEAVPASIYW